MKTPKCLVTAAISIGLMILSLSTWPTLEGLIRLEMARLLYESGSRHEARAQLVLLGEQIRSSRNSILEYMYLITKTKFALEEGDEITDLELLHKAIMSGRMRGYEKVLYFWDPSIREGIVKGLKAAEGREMSQEQPGLLPRPEADSPATTSEFAATLSDPYWLLDEEKPVGFPESNVVFDSHYFLESLSPFERLYSLVEEKWKNRGSMADLEEALHLTQRAIHLYQESFLPSNDQQAWIPINRDRWRGEFIQLISWSGDFLRQEGRYEEAVECYEKALEIEAFAEELYQDLMTLHQDFGQHPRGFAVYERCVETLSDYSREPSQKTQAIYTNLLRESSLSRQIACSSCSESQKER